MLDKKTPCHCHLLLSEMCTCLIVGLELYHLPSLEGSLAGVLGCHWALGQADAMSITVGCSLYNICSDICTPARSHNKLLNHHIDWEHSILQAITALQALMVAECKW